MIQGIIIGKEYIFTDIINVGSGKRIKKKYRVKCIGIYPHLAQFDFGKYKRSLTWFDVNKQIKSLGGRK